MERSSELNRVYYGAHDESIANTALTSANPTLTLSWEGTVIETQMIGDYNQGNINTAIAIGSYFEVSQADICSALEEYQPTNNRSQLIEKGSVRIVMDAYNANPDSMEAALNNFSQLKGANKLLILGDMLELGIHAEDAHLSIVNRLEESENEAILVGTEFLNAASKSTIPSYANAKEAANDLSHRSLQDYLILIKGSRGIRLESLLDSINP